MVPLDDSGPARRGWRGLLSRWISSIRFKLLGIVSLTLLVSLGAMTLLAGRLFRSRSEVLIQESNLSLARLIGQKVTGDLEALVYSSRVLASTTQPGDRALARYYRAHPSVLHFSVARVGSGGRPLAASWRSAFLRSNAIPEERLRQIVTTAAPRLIAAAAGSVVIENLSAELPVPLIGLAFAADPGATDRTVLVVLESARLLRAFETTGQAEIFQLMMVNPQGTVIASSDRAEALAAADRSKVPIVASLLAGAADNGSRKYTFDGVEYLGSFQSLGLAGLGVVSTVRSERAFAAVTRIRTRNIQLSLLVLTVAFLVVFFFSRTLTIPIVRLVRATREVEAGRYDVQIEPTSDDEVGVLTRSFLAMARGLEERERIKDTFGKFVNPKIVERALRQEVGLGGEDRVCTVLFTDLRNFTGLSEKAEPHEVVQLLNSYFTSMVECIHSSGGVVDKFIGDAIMAHWGALEATEDHARQAIDAALAMRRALIAYNAEVTAGGRPAVRFGCGINTGHVIAGQIGSQSRLEYTVIGDAVNLASRIEYLNKLFGTDILISRYAYERVKGIYRLARTQPVSIKGKSAPETVYAVLGRLDDPNAPKTVAELRAQLGIEWSTAVAREKLAGSSDRLASGEPGADAADLVSES